MAVELAVPSPHCGVRALNEDLAERGIALQGVLAPPPAAALSLLPGQTPARAAQCVCEEKTPMSGPSAAKMAPAAAGPVPGVIFGRLVDRIFDRMRSFQPSHVRTCSGRLRQANDRNRNPARLDGRNGPACV